MKLRAISLAAVIATTATPTLSADFLLACGQDIPQYCSAVEPGYGRLISCLYAHELVLSDSCSQATNEMSDILDTIFASIREVVQACSADIRVQCADVAAGEGRVFMCLAANRQVLSDDCGTIIGNVQLPPE